MFLDIYLEDDSAPRWRALVLAVRATRVLSIVAFLVGVVLLAATPLDPVEATLVIMIGAICFTCADSAATRVDPRMSLY